jgi:hypothetical protein
MPLPLPELDDRSYADLVDYARSLIPTYDYDWTDHNASDPGITLIELFAWLAEMLVYRTDQVTWRHRQAFLRLLNGEPDWEPEPAPGETKADVVDREIRKAILELRKLDQAVTDPDYESLAVAHPTVARALAVGFRDLEGGSEAERTAPRSGHVSVLAVPKDPALLAAELDDDALNTLGEFLAELARYLDGYRVLTTRLHVVTPSRAPVGMELLIARKPDVRDTDLEAAVLLALRDFLDPLAGGAQGEGWPFGRSVYVSEIVQRLEGLDAVDYVPDVELSSHCVPEISLCVEAPRELNDEGDLVRLVLEMHHLPILRVQVSPDGTVTSPDVRIVSAAAFVPVIVAVDASAAATLGRSDPLRAIKSAVRELLQLPGLDAHFPLASKHGELLRTIESDALETLLAASLEPQGITIGGVTLVGDRVESDELNDRTTLDVARDELVDVTPRIVLTETA